MALFHYKHSICITLLAGMAVSLSFTSCKPTEANYQSAYDAALAKRNQVDPDADILFGNHKLASPLGAVPEVVGTDTILSLRAPATLINPSAEADGARFRTVVAYYRMEQNAVDHAARLKNQGNKGTAVAKLGDEKYLVVANSASTLAEGAAFTANLTRTTAGPWIGLTPPEPLLLITNK